jgi:hypothetical protein
MTLDRPSATENASSTARKEKGSPREVGEVLQKELTNKHAGCDVGWAQMSKSFPDLWQASKPNVMLVFPINLCL